MVAEERDDLLGVEVLSASESVLWEYSTADLLDLRTGVVSSLVADTCDALLVERDIVEDCVDSLAPACESFCAADPLPLRPERVSLTMDSGLVFLLPGVTFS